MSPAGPESGPSPSASKTRSARSRPAPRPSSTSRNGDGLEDGDERGGRSSAPGRPGTICGSPRRAHVAEHDARQDVCERRADERRRPASTTTNETSACGPSVARRISSRMACAIPTGMATMIGGDDHLPEDHPRPRERLADGDGPARQVRRRGSTRPSPGFRLRRRSGPIAGDEPSSRGHAAERRLEQTRHLAAGLVDRRRPRARSSRRASGPTVPSMTRPM